MDPNHRHSLFGQKSRVSPETRASPSNSAQRENQNGRFRHCFAPYSIRLRLGICVQITAVVNAGIRHLAECQGTTLEHVSAAARRNSAMKFRKKGCFHWEPGLSFSKPAPALQLIVRWVVVCRKGEPNVPQLQALVRKVLIERFGMKMHREQREIASVCVEGGEGRSEAEAEYERSERAAGSERCSVGTNSRLPRSTASSHMSSLRSLRARSLNQLHR